MNNYRKTAIIVAVLFIIATLFLFIGEAVYGPVLDAPDYLTRAYPERITVIIGILLEFACVISIPLIPIVAFPVLRKYSETLALGYVGFRFFEAVLFFTEQYNKLSLISVSEGYLNQAGGDVTYFERLGSSIQAENGWIFSFYLFVFTIGAMLFYTALYRSRLIPRWLSGWGFLAAVLLLTGNILQMLEVELFGSTFELIFAMPIAVQEMVMALWLIVKGFNSSTIPVPEEEAIEAKLAYR